MVSSLKKISFVIAGATLLVLSLVGWYVLFVQNPTVLVRARLLYIQAKSSGIDLNSGPCLGKIADDWVLDIAHLPREDMDNLPENQCDDYRTGKVHHFVEMTPKGEVVIIK